MLRLRTGIARRKGAALLLSMARRRVASLWPVEPDRVTAVVYTNPDYLPPLINEAWELDSVDMQLQVICRDYYPRWQVTYPDTMQVHRLACRVHSIAVEYPLFVLRVLTWPGRRPAAVVGHDAYGFVAARLRSWLIRRPLIYRCHDFREAHHARSVGERGVLAFERRFARTADLVVVPDAERGEVIRRELRLARPPLVVANAPRRNAWELSRQRNQLNTEIEKRGKKFSRVVLRQGKMGPGHAIEATVRSMPHWMSCDWGLVLLGFSNAEYVAQLTALATSLGVADQLVVLPAVRYDDVAAFSAGADLGHALYEPTHVNNRYITTASNKIMEYMASGLPLLVSDRPGLQALIRGYDCGVVADESAPVDIARAVNAVLGDEAERQRLGINARRAFEDTFCFERQFAPVLTTIARGSM